MPNKLSNTFQNLDLFGQHIEFIENGREAFTTLTGAFISTLLIILVLIYGINKFYILNDFGDSNLSEYVEGEYNDHRTGVGYDTYDNFIAFEIKSKLPTEELSKVYDVQFVLKNLKDRINLHTHRCNDTDFDLYLNG